MKAIGLLAVASFVLGATPAFAQDLNSGVFVDTHLGTAIELSGEKKRLTLSLRQDFARHSRGSIRLELSAPLDEDTRIAAFTGSSLDPVPGFRARVFIGGDSIRNAVTNGAGAPTPRSTSGLQMDPSGHEGDSLGFEGGAELAYAYDRLNVLDASDLSLEATQRSTYELRIGGRGAIHFFGNAHMSAMLTMQSGIEVARSSETESATVCTQHPSSDPSMTAESCEDGLLATTDASTEYAGYASVSTVVLFDVNLDGVQAGVNFSLNAYDLSRDASTRLVWRSVFFFSPTSRSVPVMFGVGFDVNSHPQRGDRELIPFAMLGGSLTGAAR